MLALPLVSCSGGNGGRDTSSPSGTVSAAGYKTISAAQAKALMDGPEKPFILDVRTKEEYDSGHIAKAVLIPYDDIEKSAQSLPADKDALILVYCRSGRRSAIAGGTLASLGYTRVYDFGGVIDWEYGLVTD